MNTTNLIPLSLLFMQYNLEMSFFFNLNEMGLLEILTVNETKYVRPESVHAIEKMIRLHQELEVNMHGIDVILNLLEKIERLQQELISVKNRLSLYES
ncbi:MerR HTH family regulatory protein [Flavobacterium omnivorum]|uniref:MerR HTH family regulatory protein n=1 Tax=Flavobacterium omnivorum TaxID=178355 RepID=A0A1G8ALV1_9FLAO|nr:chaperone modulator CbpM [Flavobacterium omnivorum]MBC7748062.1 chaperone modulator CbpM [Flavobacterium sp.]SDH21941.1 MerR HTH family regulatory protein [Flavobacterium omnivorum]